MANEAPQKANSASFKTFQGLEQALNSFQQDLVNKQKAYEYPDIYKIEFQPQTLGEFGMSAPGSYVQSKDTRMGDQNQATRPDTNVVDTKSVTFGAHSGMQITQLIDQIMQQSQYITNQTKKNFQSNEEETPESTGKTQATKWYKINFNAVPYQYDKKRSDFAYKVTYTITPYHLVDINSIYFNPGQFRGVHKSYNYWFTGQNKEILQYEQELNKQWNFTVSGHGVIDSINQQNAIEKQKVQWQPSTGSRQGRSGDINEPQANGVNYLMSPTDMSRVRIKIIGDPAWLQQGEGSGSIFSPQSSQGPFGPDGSINYDEGQICFKINWNTPQDYDISRTGLMNPTKSTMQNSKTASNTSADITQANMSVTYVAIICKSQFSRGSFTQELEGRLYQDSSLSWLKQSQTSAQTTINTNNTAALISGQETTVLNTVTPSSSDTVVAIASNQATGDNLRTASPASIEQGIAQSSSVSANQTYQVTIDA